MRAGRVLGQVSAAAIAELLGSTVLRYFFFKFAVRKNKTTTNLETSTL